MNRSIIAKALGALISVLALLTAIPLWIDTTWAKTASADGLPVLPATATPWLTTMITGLVIGIGLWLSGYKAKASDMGIKEGMAVTTLSYIFGSMVAGLGISLAAPGTPFIHGWFEAMSGLTTTGSSIFGGWTDTTGMAQGYAIEQLTYGLLAWRALLQWMGGIGIVVISLALIPLLVGGSGFQMYRSEVPGLSADRLAPRIANTARILLSFYCTFTALCMVLMLACGVSFFDAFCHTLAAVSTGGFSPYDNSVSGLANFAAEWVLILSMFCAGLNFSLLITALRGKPLRIFQSTETRIYTGIIIIAWILLIIIVGCGSNDYHDHPGELIQDCLFKVVSLGTSTGFGNGFEFSPLGWAGWPPAALITIVTIMAIGACAGSTAGGLKVIRVVIAWLACRRELRRFMEPARMTPVNVDGTHIQDRTILQVYAFVVVFFITWLLGTILFVLFGNNLTVSITAPLTAISNMGPGLGDIGPSCNFGHLNSASHTTAIVLMLLGRLEFFGVLMTLRPRHWIK